MEITVARQTIVFLMSIGLGAVLGVCYDFFRVARVAVRHSAVAVAVEDIVYSSVCIAATFLFLLETEYGEVRLFLLAGECVGFVLYYFTVGMLVLGMAKSLIGAVRAVAGFIFRAFISPVLRLGAFILRFCRRIYKSFSAFTKKSLENANRHLK